METIQYTENIDIKEYLKLRKTTTWNQIHEHQAIIGIKNAAYSVSAVNENNETVGIARLVSDGGYVRYIADVIVLPKYQGKEIGKSMVEKIMHFIEDTMNEGDTVLVSLMCALGKESFYNKFGFETRPNETYGAGMTQWIKK